MITKNQNQFNKFDEHYVIPLIWCFITVSAICILYLVTEYFTSTTILLPITGLAEADLDL